MGPHHYHVDQQATDLRRHTGTPGLVLVGCLEGEECERLERAFDLVPFRKETRWIREGMD